MSEEDNVQAKLGATYDKSQVIKVYLTGISYNDNQGFRVWSGGRNNARTSNVESVNSGSKGVAFTREITLNPAENAEADTFDTITVCGPSFGAKVSDLELTSMYYKVITVGPKPTLAPGELDLSKHDGIGQYDIETNQYIINDSTENPCYFDLNETVKNGESVTVTVEGTWTGTTAFRVWIGNGDNCGSTIQVYKNADLPQGKFSKTFTLTANGNDGIQECTKLTIKALQSWNGGGPINGLTIDHIIVTKN